MNGIKRPKILPRPVGNYEHAWSTYPDSLRVSFENGQTLVYRVEIKQPEPVLRKPLDRFNQVVMCGYKYKQKNRGKRTGRVDDAEL